MTAEDWSAELKRRHHYGKSLDPHSKPSKQMDLVTLEDIREIQGDAVRSFIKPDDQG